MKNHFFQSFFLAISLFLIFPSNLIISSSNAHESLDHRLPFTTEQAEKARIFNTVSKLISESKFDEIETLAAKYRNTNERSPSGLWNLTHFYESLGRYWNSTDKLYSPEETQKRRNVFFNSWRQKYPNSPTPYLAQVVLHRSFAWKTRGWGYTNTVKKEAWAPFFKHIKIARNLLDKHKKIASLDPHWYKLRIRIGVELGESKDSILTNIFEGINKTPNYYPIYFAAVAFFSPMWNGDEAKIASLADLAVKLTEKNEGQSLYARIYWAAIQGRDGNLVFFSPTMSWDRMKKGMDDVVARYPDHWNINNFLYFSCVRADKPQVQKLFKMMEGEPLLKVWGKKELFEECKRFAMTK